MSRISREQLFMEICHVLAKRSTCCRQNVGALLTYRSRIISTGWNGPPSGEDHCSGNECPLTGSGGCLRSVHAEMNTLKFANPRLGNLHLYVSLSPCTHCAKAIIEDRRVVQVFYCQEYRIKDGIQLLLDAGIPVYRVTLSGEVLDARNNEIITGQPEKMHPMSAP